MHDLGPAADGSDDTDTRLGIAVMRGLLIDVLATGDVDAATAALERYLELAEPATRRYRARCSMTAATSAAG